ACARELYAIQRQDSRIGYEATNHYFYVPADLAARAIHCALMEERWDALLRPLETAPRVGTAGTGETTVSGQ
ncbi:MAG TPA: hypothetical protein PLH06_15120, partial [Candidatus Hydrogenedentes bacterium]|nr:hypothetical protein [Candidatus Hydrogenedentota bacterium]